MLPHDVKIGDIVYPAYAPRQAGVVVEVRPKSPAEIHGMVVVEMPNGRQVSTVAVESLETLNASHRRKAEAGEKRLEEIKAYRAAKGLECSPETSESA